MNHAGSVAPASTSMVDIECNVCGSDVHTVISSSGHVRAEMAFVRDFHERRLRPVSKGRARGSALADRADFTQDYATDIVRCDGCGLIYRNPRPSGDDVVCAYATDHYGRDRLDEMFDAQCELYRPKASRLRRWLPRGRAVRVVEVGSFVGGFLVAGTRYGWHMLGVDPGKEVDEFCRDRGLPVFQGTLSEAPLASASVDCIAIWNTFDQLPEPEHTLATVRRLLRPGGLFALRVPNGNCYARAEGMLSRLHEPFAGWLRAALAWNNLLAFPYLYGYSLGTLDTLLPQYGLTRIHVEPDTLVRLADADTKRWAAAEEWLVKTAWRGVLYLQQSRPEKAAATAPWFDAYYRLTA